MSIRLVVSWIAGSLFMLLAIWILSNLEVNIGVPEFNYLVTIVLAFILILLAGFSWISVAVATRHH